MVKEVDHGIISSTGTTTVETAKGAAKGVILPILFGAAVIGLGAFGLASLASGGAITSAISSLGFPGWMGVIGAAVGAALGAAVAVPGAIIGGIFGFSKGQNRVNAEQSKFDRSQATRMGAAANPEIVQAQIAQAAQLGYVKGAQDTEQLIRQQIQQAQYAAIQEEMAKQKAATTHGKENCAPCGKHTAAEAQRREAAAAAIPVRA